MGGLRVSACPHCGEDQGFLPVQRRALSDGRRYERYFCCACRSSFEKEAAGWVTFAGIVAERAIQPAR